MSVLDAALVASPPDIHLTSPPDVPSAEFTHDPYTSSTFISQAPPASFQLNMPPSKTPRIPGHISPYIGADNEIDLSDNHSYLPSPGRRARAYPSISQGLVLPHSGYTSTPKNMGIHMGMSHSADPTPSRLHQAYSSPANDTPLHASMRFAGEDSIAGQWELGNSQNNNEDTDDTPVGKATTTTPTQSPVPSRIGSKRMLSGLGDSPMSAKRSRFASHGGGSISAHSSVPPSPSRATTLPSTSGSTRMPLERSISLAAPPFATQSRQVSGMSMVSSASTELISPALMPTYEGSFEMMPTFPTSMSAPEMGHLSALASYESHSNSPIVASFPHPTLSPHEVLPPSFASFQTAPVSVYPSPIPGNAIIPTQPQTTPGTSPSLASAQVPYYGALQSGSMTLGTIHEVEHVADVPPEVTPVIHATPTLAVASQPPSTGAPSLQTVPDARSSYPQPSFVPIMVGTPVMAGTPTPAPLDQLQAKDQDMPEFPTAPRQHFWTGKMTPHAPPPHVAPSYPPRQQRMPPPHPQSYMYAPAYYAPPPPPMHTQWGHAPPPHAFTQRSVSSDYTYGMPHPYSPYEDGASAMPSPSAYPSHPSITRSVSTPYMHSQMPMQYPSSGSASGLYAPQAPASAPMTSSVSLPNAAESSMYMADQPWNSGGVGLGLGTDQPQQYNWDSNVQHEASAQSTPTTPGRKRHPSVGKRLRPGPRPRLTPKKKGKGKASSSSVTGDEDFDEPQSVDPSPEISKALAPSAYYQPRNRYQTNAGSSSKAELELGGPLSASYAGPSHHAYTHQHPHHYPQNQLTAHILPQDGSSYGAPHLTLDPVVRPGSPEAKPGIAVDVIEDLYRVVDNPAGPTNGQGHKRFRCLIEGCEREFPRKSAIKSHIQTHLDDKPYSCHVKNCDAGFVRQHDLKRHMKIHSGTKPFKCPCLKEFARGDALRRHQERKLDPACTGEKESTGNPYPRVSGSRSRHRL